VHWVAIAAGDVPGWLRLQTMRHGEWLWDMTGDEAAEFGPLAAALSAALRRVTGAARVYLIALGENSLHMHALLIPRYGDNFGGSDGIREDLTEGLDLSPEDRDKIRFRNALKLLKIKD
jgi:diadenosine tetraphosphate (Ap4A) HIT family hydrolase